MDGTASFWLGLALSIPIAIGVNLLTPLIQSLLSTVSIGYRNKRAEKNEREKSLALRLAADDVELKAYMSDLSIQQQERRMIGFAFFGIAGLFSMALASGRDVGPVEVRFAFAAIVGISLLIFVYSYMTHIRASMRYDKIMELIRAENDWNGWS